jgi:lysyl-tRNA synthetase class 2
MSQTPEDTGLSSDITEVRAQKLAKLRETVAEVYPAHFHRTMTNKELAREVCGYRTRHHDR